MTEKLGPHLLEWHTMAEIGALAGVEKRRATWTSVGCSALGSWWPKVRQPIRPFEAAADERTAQVVAGVEKTGYVIYLDHRTVLALLLVNRHPERLPIRHSWRWAALGELAHKPEVKIIEQYGG